ncbi:exonuclease domain-containing protein [Roseobacteraceae bacterium S113]
MLGRLSLRLRVFLFFALLALGAMTLIAGGLSFGWMRADPRPDVAPFVVAFVVAGLSVMALVTWIWWLFDENLAHPMQAMAAQMRVLAEGRGGKALPEAEARYLGDLAPAAQAITAQLQDTQSDLTLAIRRETQSLADEKERLEALLADVGVGVVLCARDHTVVFYNSRARDLLSARTAPRLDQPITECLREGPVLAAYDQLTHGQTAPEEVEFSCANGDGSAMFVAQMRLVPQGNDRAGGYVLTLRDVTEAGAAALTRESLLADIVDDMRRRAAGLEMLVTLQHASPDEGLGAALVDETRAFVGSVARFAERFDESRAVGLAGRSIAACDLLDGAAARLRGRDMQCEVGTNTNTNTSAGADAGSVAVDGVTIVALLGHLAERLKAERGVTDFDLSVENDAAGALLRLGWRGAGLDMATLEGWLAQDIELGDGTFPARFVLSRHGSEIWPLCEGGRAQLCMPLRRAPQRLPDPGRGAVYDFALFDKSRLAARADLALDALSYVVFDTETTGLLPTQGDEIVQIAALRLMGGRIVAQETLDMLVDPGRAIPAAARRIHGISDEMVAGAPDIAVAGRAMHDFCKGAVLVAHNAPFDMAFFHKHAGRIGHEFDNPVLDTVLMSAVLFGVTAEHTLDALCERLAIDIPTELRHTAMGDARATAEAFSQMLGMLQARGVKTLGAVHDALKKQTRLYRGRRI